MPRVSKLTYDLVASAVRRVELSGKNTTIANVRFELGNFGSNSDIKVHMDAWRAERLEELKARVPGEVEALKAENLALRLKVAEIEMAGIDPALRERMVYWEQKLGRGLRPYEKTKLARGVELDDDND